MAMIAGAAVAGGILPQVRRQHAPNKNKLAAIQP